MSYAFSTCRACGEYDFTDRHKCKPKWEVAMEAKKGEVPDESEWAEIYAIDQETAAEKYADQYDCESAEYAIVSAGSGGETIVLSRDPATPEKITRWHVIGEAVPQYHARLAE